MTDGYGVRANEGPRLDDAKALRAPYGAMPLLTSR